jgi:putative addiction module killer protein
MEIEIELYKTASGHCPFDDWFESLREMLTRAKILTRLDRLKIGNFGDCKSIGDGISELRIHYGPGIRIYYSRIGNKLILLLCGGDKGSQNKDINKAKEYLKEYCSREKKYGKK